ncbi:MAG: hypothetical protein L0210_15525 [Rhodospirillales bacterium]|nr:hypothetical protein [Rhodospirillales bacterium]
MSRHKRRRGNWPPGEAKRNDHQGRIMSAAEPGTNPQPARSAHGKSREIAKRFTREAFKALAAVMQDQEAAATARVNAANTILEWGHGKRGDSAKAPEVIEKILKVDWGED